jgi:hypothetical protein
MKAYRGGGTGPRILTSALDGGEWSASRPSHIATGKRAPGIQWIGSWVGPRAGLDTVLERKIPRHPAGTRTPDHPAHSLHTILTELSWLQEKEGGIANKQKLFDFKKQRTILPNEHDSKPRQCTWDLQDEAAFTWSTSCFPLRPVQFQLLQTLQYVDNDISDRAQYR